MPSGRTKDRTGAHTCASNLSLQTMMSSRIHPGAHVLKERGASRIDPSIHDVRFAAAAEAGRKLVFRDRWRRLP